MTVSWAVSQRVGLHAVTGTPFCLAVFSPSRIEEGLRLSAPSHAMNLGGANGIVIKARGDGRTYRESANTRQSGGQLYRADLPTIKGEFVEVMIPFSDFKLQAFGKFVPDSKAIDPAAIHSVGFSIADEQAGPFEIEIEPVKAFQGQSNAAGNTKKRS